jgi:hypothetical protein
VRASRRVGTARRRPCASRHARDFREVAGRAAGTSGSRETNSVGATASARSAARPAARHHRTLSSSAWQSARNSVHTRIVEAAGDGREDRQLGIRQLHAIGMIAPPLLAHVAQCVFGTALFEFVQHDHVGKVEHVDLFQLARRAVLGRHDIQRQVGEIDDFRVALTDARRLDDDQIEPDGAIQRDHVGQHRAGRQMLAPRRQRTHEHIRHAQRIHADAVA